MVDDLDSNEFDTGPAVDVVIPAVRTQIFDGPGSKMKDVAKRSAIQEKKKKPRKIFQDEDQPNGISLSLPLQSVDELEVTLGDFNTEESLSPYQLYAVKFMYQTKRVLLADAPGLGLKYFRFKLTVIR